MKSTLSALDLHSRFMPERLRSYEPPGPKVRPGPKGHKTLTAVIYVGPAGLEPTTTAALIARLSAATRI